MPPTLALLALIILLAVTGMVQKASGQVLLDTTCPADACSAVERRDPNALRKLIIAGRTGCFCICDNNPLVHASVLSECPSCIDYLTAPPSDCNLDWRDRGGNTPLHEAAAICQIVMANYLLDRGASVAIVNRGRLTPLCEAARQDDPACGDVVRSLVNAGADICAKCRDMTPLEFAVDNNVRKVLVEEGGADC